MINFPNGFQITSNEPIDARIVLSKEQMKLAKKPNMPDVYFALCVDDGNFYIYNTNNEIDEETGRYRIFENNGDIDIESLISSNESNLIAINTDGTISVEDNEAIADETIKALFPEI